MDVLTAVVSVVTAVLVALGGVYAAYNFLMKAVDRRITDQDLRMDRLDGRLTEESQARQREMVERLKKDNEHVDARRVLDFRITELDKELRRLRDEGQDE